MKRTKSAAFRRWCIALAAAGFLFVICAGCAEKSGHMDNVIPEEAHLVIPQVRSGIAAEKAEDEDGENVDTDKKTTAQSVDEKSFEEVKTEASEEIKEETLPTQNTAKVENNTEVSREIQPETAASDFVENKDTDTGITAAGGRCIISISCSSILQNMDRCDESVKSIVPEDGVVLAETISDFSNGETVFDVLERVCQGNGIPVEFNGSVDNGNVYIKGIANLYEKEVGSTSGWMYCVNGAFPPYGCSVCSLKDGDTIQWIYTCE